MKGTVRHLKPILIPPLSMNLCFNEIEKANYGFLWWFLVTAWLKCSEQQNCFSFQPAAHTVGEDMTFWVGL